MKSLGFLGLVFDAGFSVTPLMSHLGCLASHWSVPVYETGENGAKISSISHSNGPILVGHLRESQANG